MIEGVELLATGLLIITLGLLLIVFRRWFGRLSSGSIRETLGESMNRLVWAGGPVRLPIGVGIMGIVIGAILVAAGIVRSLS